jgi:hypothetical protein
MSIFFLFVCFSGQQTLQIYRDLQHLLEIYMILVLESYVARITTKRFVTSRHFLVALKLVFQY